MIGALFILLAMLIILAVFIGKNVHHTCSVWLFHDFKDMSSVSVILIAFAAGIVFTMLCFFVSNLIKKNKKKKSESEETKSEQKKDEKKSKPAFSFGRNKKSADDKKSESPLAAANEKLAKENELL